MQPFLVNIYIPLILYIYTEYNVLSIRIDRTQEEISEMPGVAECRGSEYKRVSKRKEGRIEKKLSVAPFLLLLLSSLFLPLYFLNLFV